MEKPILLLRASEATSLRLWWPTARGRCFWGVTSFVSAPSRMISADMATARSSEADAIATTTTAAAACAAKVSMASISAMPGAPEK
jgi:hypothetical protein